MANVDPEKMAARRSEFEFRVAEELDRAYVKHGNEQWGRHEFYGILAEEFRELETAIFTDKPMTDVVSELVQVAAMCVRYYETGDRYGYISKVSA